MGLEYLPTFIVDFYGKRLQIYHTWLHGLDGIYYLHPT